jgi:hypothetical protein
MVKHIYQSSLVSLDSGSAIFESDFILRVILPFALFFPE